MLLRGAGAIALLCLPLAAQSTDAGGQLYRTHCYVCHGENGDAVAGVNFRSGFRRASTDEEVSRIILGGIPGTGMPPTNLNEAQRRDLVAYLRSMHAPAASAMSNGNAASGRAIVEGKGGCLACHRIGDKGSHAGPDLGDVGSLRQAAYLERSLLDPSETVAPQNRWVRATLKDGATVSGRRLNEDTHTVQLIDAKEKLVSLSKSDLREYELVKTSPMPPYAGKLSPQEIADVVSYLLTLKGSQ